MKFTKQVPTFKLLLILIFSALSQITEGQSLKYAPHSKNFKGKIKKIDTYQYQAPIFDTVNITSEIEMLGSLVSSREFDKNSGNLVHIDKYNPSFDYNSTADFIYDEEDNLLMSFGFNPIRDRDTTWYEYDYENLTIVKTSSRKARTNIEGVSKIINSMRDIYDSNYNKIGMEYIGMQNELLLYQKYHYDEKNKLIQIQNYNNTELGNSVNYQYDKLNRKKVIQTIDRNGNFLRKSSYSYFKNGYTVSNYKKDGSLRDRHKVIQFKDKQDNIIKEYNFNFDTKRTIILEYKIEYF